MIPVLENLYPFSLPSCSATWPVDSHRQTPIIHAHSSTTSSLSRQMFSQTTTETFSHDNLSKPSSSSQCVQDTDDVQKELELTLISTSTSFYSLYQKLLAIYANFSSSSEMKQPMQTTSPSMFKKPPGQVARLSPSIHASLLR